MSVSGGFSNIFFKRFVAALKYTRQAWRRDMQCLSDREPDPFAVYARSKLFLPGFQHALKRVLRAKGNSRQFMLRFAGRDRVKQAGLGACVIGGVMLSVISVHASLYDPSTIKIIQDPKFYLGIESGYGRMALNGNGLNLATPGLPKTGIFGDQALSGSFILGASNLVDLGGGVSLRGELEYQKLGKPNMLNNECCTTNPLSMFYSRDIETNSGFANLWLDFDLPFKSTKLFLGGGLGFATHSITSVNSALFNSRQNTQLAYHLGGGISHNLSSDVEFVVAGRYRDLGASKLNLNNDPNGSRNIKQTGFEARIGLRYKLESLMPKR